MQELKELYPDESEEMLNNFLVARRGNASKAAKMYALNREWRKKWADNNPLSVEEVEALSPGYWKFTGEYLIREDKKYPIFTADLGKLEPANFANAEKMTFFLASLLDNARKLGNSIVLNCDLQGFSVWKHTTLHALGIFKTMASVLKENYPEILFECHVHHSPYAFKLVWDIVKHLLDERTAHKIVFEQ